MMLAVSTWESILVDIPAYILALGSAVAAIVAAKRGGANGEKIAEVHSLVNDRSEKQDNRIDQLSTALTGAGVEIPSKPNEEKPNA